jgi:hypothetical protein
LNDLADCSRRQPAPLSAISRWKSAVRAGCNIGLRHAASKLPDPMIWAQADGELIKSPQDAINVFDFEPVAHKNVPLRPPRGVPRLTTSAVASVDSIGRRAVSADEVRGAVAGKRKPHETLDVGRDGSLG